MNVLQLCSKPPYPPVDGGTLAMNSITQALLSEGCHVKVLSVESDKHKVAPNSIDDSYLAQTDFESVYIDLSPKILPALVAMLCGQSYHVQRFRSNNFAQRLKTLLSEQDYDIVHIESIFLAPYIPLIRRHSNAKIVLRAHNVEHLIWQQIAQQERNLFRRWYLRHTALALRMYELDTINLFDGIICITDDDAAYLRANGCRRPICTIPFGVEPEEIVGVDVDPNALFHIGAMDWLPNLDGIDWFLKDVWQQIHSSCPQAHLYLAGRKMPKRLLDSNIDGVTVIGEVPDAYYFIAGKNINIVPIRSSGGIRVKILEAMSAGKVVISTSVGARGIHYTDDSNILIADTAADFARQVKRCLDDPSLCQQIGTAALQLINDEYSQHSVSKKLIHFYTDKILNDEPQM